MFHCLIIKVVCLSSLFDSLFTLSYLSDLVKHFFQKFLRFSKSCLKLFVSVVLFKRLGYFIISSVIYQQLIRIFWKLFYFSAFQKQFLATACLFYLIFSCLSRTFLSFFITFFDEVFVFVDDLSTLSQVESFVNHFFDFFIFLKNQKRRRRDLNPRAALTTYTLSRGTSSASWVLLQSPNYLTNVKLWSCASFIAHLLLYLKDYFLSTSFLSFFIFYEPFMIMS